MFWLRHSSRASRTGEEMVGRNGDCWVAGYGPQLPPTGKDSSSHPVPRPQTRLPSRSLSLSLFPLYFLSLSFPSLFLFLSLSVPTSEDGGRDLACVVSSLAQLMMDPHYRSISGFQALVQKDWVSMGHPFTARHHLLTKPPTASPDSVATDEPPVEVCIHYSGVLKLIVICMYSEGKAGVIV